MDGNLKKFVPSSVCLKCEGCCRFSDAQSLWRPLVTEQEAQRLAADPHEILFQGRLKTITRGETPHCCFLDHQTNACTVYSRRPFECRLYPFILRQDNRGPHLAVHLLCPFVEKNRRSPDFEAYLDYLKEFFGRAEIRGFLKRNPRFFGAYPRQDEELEFLFSIPL